MIQNILNTIIIYIQENWGAILLKAILGSVVFIGGYILIQRIVNTIKKKVEANSLQDDVYIKRTSNLVGKLIFILLFIFLILAVFQVIGFDTAIIMGWISMSIGFAMETTIGNMISWVMILTNKKIKIGDYILLWGSLNMRWTIEEINVRYTVFRTFDKKRTIIPNSIIAKTPMQTYKTEPLLRGEIMFTVPRHTHIPQVKQILIETINAHTKVLYKEYTNTRIENFDSRCVWLPFGYVCFKV